MAAVKLVQNSSTPAAVAEYLFIKLVPFPLIIWGFWKSMTRRELILTIVALTAFWVDIRTLIYAAFAYSLWFTRTGQHLGRKQIILFIAIAQLAYWSFKSYQRLTHV